MKFSCEKYLIQAACAVASRATASKSTIPALEGLLLEAELGLRVTGYDLKRASTPASRPTSRKRARSSSGRASSARCCAACRTAS